MKKSDIISHLQAKEAELWLDLTSYNKILASAASDSDQLQAARRSDPEYSARHGAWMAVSGLLDSLGLSYGYELPAFKAALENVHETRRILAAKPGAAA